VIRIRELMIARSALAGEKDFQVRVNAAEAEFPRAAAELSQMLLGPVSDKLGSRRLVFVAEGALQYLPFGALPAPQTVQASTSTPLPLVEEHEIVNLPSASTLAVIRREAPLRSKPDRTLAIFADPVFDKTDTRVKAVKGVSSTAKLKPASTSPQAKPATSLSRSIRQAGVGKIGAGIDLPRLPSTQIEADTILLMVPENSRLVALGFQATKAAAMNPDLKRYRIVHFATHTRLNDEYPDLSSLVLSLVDERGNPQDGNLRLRDMYNLSLSAELVVLSACETALGKEVKGEGLISMVRGFMYSGTPRVLASLWKVDDQATAELMKEFYGQIFEHNLSPAAALRQAQIAQRRKKSRQAPYYWAGFQLQGDWK
jgi:CHAT domain-containing protein